jgi:choline dehydrogenase-like flavoprotein
MKKNTEYDAIIIGSGFGGSMVAQVLISAANTTGLTTPQ